MDQFQETPTLPARYYRQNAAEARRAAEGATTRAAKARLDGLAREFDRLADAADRAAQKKTRPPGWPGSKSGSVDNDVIAVDEGRERP